MTEIKKQPPESVIESSTLLDCPYCDNDGWYIVTNAETGEPEQCQCQFCWTEERSVFNSRSNVTCEPPNERRMA